MIRIAAVVVIVGVVAATAIVAVASLSALAPADHVIAYTGSYTSVKD